MGIFTKDIDSLDDLFVHMLKDIYYAEQQMLKSLPDMINKATNPQLRSRFEEHLAATRNQVRRLERVFEMHGVEPQTVTCPAIKGIIKEANEIAGEANNKEILDAALIATAQAVEHYEISRYGALISWAKQLGRDDCADVLHQNLVEERDADQRLTEIAESNMQAAH